MEARAVTLRSTRDESGIRFLEARLSEDGKLTFEGQDLGRGVGEFFGQDYGEYEWVWTVEPAGVELLSAALDSPEDVLEALARRFSGEASAYVGTFLEAQGIPYSVWSRVGD